MARTCRSGMVAAVVIGVAVICADNLMGAVDDPWIPTTPVSLSLRPKLGELLVASGDVGDYFDGFVQGEVGLKGTYNHFGLEWTIGCMGSNSYNSRFRSASPEAVSGIMKVTGTVELNPMAGLPKRTDNMSAFDLKEANVYVGAGMGYYPTWIGFDDDYDDDEYYDGGGIHAVVGAEYFFQTHIGVFGECQYTYLSYRFDNNMDKADMHGFSLLLGLTVKF